MSVFQITPTTQKYDWGKVGAASKVADFATSISGFELDNAAPYAELWMGTHVTSPSRVASSGALLSDHLKANPGLIGDKVIQKFEGAGDGNLPFLFKVLSIAKALSIQTHPDKETAKKLHKEQPDVYKDANHKPEMAVAVTPFEALCGFLPVPQIVKYLQSVPEFAALIPQSVKDDFISVSETNVKPALKAVFSALMTADKSKFVPELEKLISRITAGEAGVEKRLVDLVVQLNKDFPQDIGVFCPFMLNYVELSPGQAIFLGAGEPHAYVSGDIMECMATSDNVIRAGLTPKLRDIPNLVSGLTYEPAEHTKHLVKASKFSDNTLLFNPPVPEFSVLHVELDGKKTEAHPAIDGPSIAVVSGGSGAIKWGNEELKLGKGNVFFIGAGEAVEFRGVIEVYRAFVEV